MAMRYGHEVVSYVRMPDGKLEEFSAMQPEKKQCIREKLVENMSRGLGTYLSEHPEEIEPFSHCIDVKLIPDKEVMANETPD